MQGGVAQCFSLLFPTGLYAVLVVCKTHAKVELFACVYLYIYLFFYRRPLRKSAKGLDTQPCDAAKVKGLEPLVQQVL